MGNKDKGQVIKIGEDLFRSQGYFNTGTEEILRKSDYPRSSFYHHFKSKEGFAIQVLEQYGNDAERYYTEVLTNKNLGSPLTRLKYLTGRITQTAKKNEFKKECLIQKISIECAANSAILCEAANEQMSKLLNTLKECIKLGQTKNEIRKDIDAMHLAEFLQAQIFGSFMLGRLQKDVSVFEANIKKAYEYIEG